VSDAAKEFANLKAMHAGAVLLKEGGQPVALLPGFGFTVGEQAHKMDLLLVPFAHSGYVTRLFFERQIAGRGANWNQHQPHTSYSSYAGHDVVEVLTKCRVQHLSHGDVRFVDARRY
jgi:hypothetical protein